MKTQKRNLRHLRLVQRKTIPTSLAAFLLTLSAPLIAKSKDDAPPPKMESKKSQETLTSQSVFRHYMDEFPIRSLFRRAQWEHLNTAEDTAFTHFFYDANEYFGQLFDQLKALHNSSLEGFSRYAQANMLKLRPGYTKTYDRVHKTISDVAGAIGFSTEAVQNLEIYLTDGEMQAFTVSGNNNRIIVVVETELLERLNEYEVRAVLAHELGHIRSLHSVKDTMHRLFLNFALRYYATPTALHAANQPAEVETLRINHIRKSHSSNHEIEQNSFSEQETTPLILQKLNDLLKLPPDQQQALVTQYISLLMNVLVAENGSPSAVGYFQQLLQTQPASYTTHSFDTQKFVHFAEHAQMAISRAAERSADRYMTSNVPNEYGVSTMAKLAGHPFQPNAKIAREEFESVSKMIQLQVKEFFEKYGDEDISPFVGSSHPATSLRLVNILNTPHYPDILFANPFFRLLLLEDLIQNELKMDKSLFKFMVALQNDIVELVDGFGLSSPKNARFNKVVQFYALNKRIQVEQLRQFQERTIPDVFNDSEKNYFTTTIHEASRSAQNTSPVLIKLRARLSERVTQAKMAVSLDNSSEKKQELALLQDRLDIVSQLITSQNPQLLQALHEGVLSPDQLGKRAEKRNLPVSTPLTSNPLGPAARCSALLSTLAEVDEMLQQKTVDEITKTQ